MAEEIKEYAVGRKLPPLRDLAKSYGVSVKTAQDAVHELQRRELVYSTPQGTLSGL